MLIIHWRYLGLIEREKKGDDKKKSKYKLTKELSVQYTKQLLSNDAVSLQVLDLHAKQDDLCDSYLQGRYYLEHVRKPDEIVIVPDKVDDEFNDKFNDHEFNDNELDIDFNKIELTSPPKSKPKSKSMKRISTKSNIIVL